VRLVRVCASVCVRKRVDSSVFVCLDCRTLRVPGFAGYQNVKENPKHKKALDWSGLVCICLSSFAAEEGNGSNGGTSETLLAGNGSKLILMMTI